MVIKLYIYLIIIAVKRAVGHIIISTREECSHVPRGRVARRLQSGLSWRKEGWTKDAHMEKLFCLPLGITSEASSSRLKLSSSFLPEAAAATAATAGLLLSFSSLAGLFLSSRDFFRTCKRKRTRVNFARSKPGKRTRLVLGPRLPWPLWMMW